MISVPISENEKPKETPALKVQTVQGGNVSFSVEDSTAGDPRKRAPAKKKSQTARRAGKLRKPRRGGPENQDSCHPYGHLTGMLCPNKKFFLFYRLEGNEVIAKKVVVPCDTWSCPVCAQLKRKKMYRKLKDACPKSKFHMLTLTLRLNDDTLAENWKRLQKAWDTLLKRLKRKFPHQIKYFRCTELQKNGMPHIHALINCFLEKYELQKIWKEITEDSFIAQFEEIRYSAVGYILKYFQKAIQDLPKIRAATGKKTKLFVYSRYLLIREKHTPKWKLWGYGNSDMDIELLFAELKDACTWEQGRCTKFDTWVGPGGYTDLIRFRVYPFVESFLAGKDRVITL